MMEEEKIKEKLKLIEEALYDGELSDFSKLVAIKMIVSPPKELSKEFKEWAKNLN